MKEDCNVTYEVIPTDQFEKDIRYYIKKKNYRKIQNDIEPIIAELEQGNLVGDEIAGLELPDDEHSFKVRAANSSAKVGKSNGFRIVYYVVKDDKEIFLLTIYSKKDQVDISIEEIKRLIRLYCV